jgi:hypothetical protein
MIQKDLKKEIESLVMGAVKSRAKEILELKTGPVKKSRTMRGRKSMANLKN